MAQEKEVFSVIVIPNGLVEWLADTESKHVHSIKKYKKSQSIVARSVRVLQATRLDLVNSVFRERQHIFVSYIPKVQLIETLRCVF